MSNGQQTPVPQTQQQTSSLVTHDIGANRPITYFNAEGKPAGVSSAGGTYYSISGYSEDLLFRSPAEAQAYAQSKGTPITSQVGVSDVPSSQYWAAKTAREEAARSGFQGRFTEPGSMEIATAPIGQPVPGSQLAIKQEYLQRGTGQWASEKNLIAEIEAVGNRVSVVGKGDIITNQPFASGAEQQKYIDFLNSAPKPGEWGYHATPSHPGGIVGNIQASKPIPLFDPLTGKPNIYFTSPSTQPEFIRDTKFGLMVREDLVKPSQYDVNVMFDKTLSYINTAEKQASTAIKSYVPEPIKGAYRGVMKSLDVYSDLPFTSPIEKQTIQFGKGFIEGIPERPITTVASYLLGGVTAKITKAGLEAAPILTKSLPLIGRIPKIGSKITPANIGSLGLLGVYGSDVATRAATAPKPAEELGKITSSEVLPFGTGMKIGESIEITKSFQASKRDVANRIIESFPEKYRPQKIEPSAKELMTPEVAKIYKQVSEGRKIKIESALKLTESLKPAQFEQMKPVNLETVKYGGKIAPGLKEMMGKQPEGYVIGGSTSVGAFVKGFRPGADIDLYAKNYQKAVKEIFVESKIKYPGAEIAEKGGMTTISSKEGHSIIDIHKYEDIQRSIASTISKQTTGKLYKPIDIKGTQYINPKLQLAAKAEGTIRALEEEVKTGKLGKREKDIADFEAIAESLIKGMPTAQRAKLFKELESYKLHSGIPAEYAYELSKPYAKYLLENVRAKPDIPYGYLQSILKGKYPGYYEPSLKAGKGGYYEPSLIPGGRGYYPVTKPSKSEYYPSTKEAAQYYPTSIYPSSKYPATTEYYPVVKPADVFKATIPTEPKTREPDRTLFKLPYFEQVPTGKKKAKKQRYNRLLKLYPIGPSENLLKAFGMKTRTTKRKTRSKRKK